MKKKKQKQNSCKTHYADHMKYEDRLSCIGTHITWMDLIDVQLETSHAEYV